MSQSGRRILLCVAAIVVVVLATGIWIVRGPDPMAFVNRNKVALAYKAGDPPVPRFRSARRALSNGENTSRRRLIAWPAIRLKAERITPGTRDKVAVRGAVFDQYHAG